MKKLNYNMCIMIICFIIITTLILVKNYVSKEITSSIVFFLIGSWLTANINYIFEDKKEIQMNIKIKKIENGTLPIYKTEGACGADCYSREEVTLEPYSTVLVPLGFALELPKGYECQVRGRSGNSSKGIQVQLGTVDCDYRGEINAIVYNATDKKLHIPVGYRIAQIVINEVPSIQFKEVETLSTTDRGTNGFGSTGVN